MMQDDTSVILFASNARSKSSIANRCKRLVNSIQQKLKSVSRAITDWATIVIFGESNDEIINKLTVHQEKLLAFHFEGHEKNYRSLLTACKNSAIMIEKSHSNV